MQSGDRPIAVQAGVPLAPLTTLGIGGSAEWFTRATTIEEVVAAHEWCRERAVPFNVMSGGSNLQFTHANGAVTPKRVDKIVDPAAAEKAAAAKAAAAKAAADKKAAASK